MTVAVGVENLTGGMGTAAFVALVMSLCNHRYTATQFALLSSVEALGRVFLGWPAAKLVGLAGWGPFFFVTFIAALPGLWLLWLKEIRHSPRCFLNFVECCHRLCFRIGNMQV
jgi:PAT family beta-lactamase induction signal transducer AmpG